MIETEKSNLDSIKEGVKAAEESATGFMNPGTKTKKRGPYKKTKEKSAKTDAGPSTASAEQPKAGSEESIQQTAMILKPVFALGSQACSRWADTPHALATPSELETVSTATAAVVEKYAPQMLDKYGAELILFATVGMYGARVVTLKRARDAEKGRFVQNGANQQTAPFHPPQVQTEDVAKETVAEPEFAMPN